jgi:hypothetical protein
LMIKTVWSFNSFCYKHPPRWLRLLSGLVYNLVHPIAATVAAVHLSGS